MVTQLGPTDLTTPYVENFKPHGSKRKYQDVRHYSGANAFGSTWKFRGILSTPHKAHIIIYVFSGFLTVFSASTTKKARRRQKIWEPLFLRAGGARKIFRPDFHFRPT